MNFSEYVNKTNDTAIYPGADSLGACLRALSYSALGLVSESGEVAGKIKKLLRGDQIDYPDFRDMIRDELGDLMWYVARICKHLELDMDDILSKNLSKLKDRKKRGVIMGSGDKR